MAILQFESAYQGGVKPLTISDEEKAAIQKAFTQTPSLLQLLSTVRSRRFGMGYRYESGQAEAMTWGKGKTVVQEKGPTGYVSKMQPHPLSELEEAIIAWAACGPNGVIAADLPVKGDMSTFLCWAGRTIPAPCNDVSVDLFITNDSGTYFYRPIAERMAPIEIASPDDYWKILKWYREDRVKISDQRIDIGWDSTFDAYGAPHSNVVGPWNYNSNRPGSTWFLPVADMGFEWFNLLFAAYEWWHVYLMDPDTGKPCGCDEFVKPGMLELGVPVPLYDELLLLATPGHQVGCLVQNIRLMCEALGLGAWVYCGVIDDAVLGAYPEVAKGLGFQYMERDPAKNPNKIATSIGLPGIKEAAVVPSPQFPTAESVCRYVYDVRYKRGAHFSKEDNWAIRNQAPYKPEVMQAILEDPNIKIADWAYEAAVKTVEYIVNKWGACPAFTNPIQCQFTAQIHHLDVDYYRTMHTGAGDGKEPFMLTNQTLNHFRDWHPGEPDPYASR
jgi:hypothetical protein